MKRLKHCLLLLVITIASVLSSKPAYTPAEEMWPEAPGISAAAAIVMEADTGAILYEKNIHEQHYPASITKIMTTLLAIEHCPLSDMVLFSNDAVNRVEGTQVGITPGEEVPLEECLYGIMLASGNEIAYAVAEHAGGSMENFVQMMNDRAAELGCLNTHFNNPHGLPDENHYTTPYDMALIAKEAYSSQIFRKIAETKYHIIPPTNLYAEERPMANHHKMLTNGRYHYDSCTGGKTGYTNAARNTLVTYAERNDMTLICVIMQDDETYSQYVDTAALFNYCFDNFHKTDSVLNSLKQNLNSSSFFPLNNTPFCKEEGRIFLTDNACVIVPNGIDQNSITSDIFYEGSGDSVIGHVSFSYESHDLGSIPVLYQPPTTTFKADNSISFSENNKKFLKVNIKVVKYIAAAVLTTALLAIIIFRINANFHLVEKIDFRIKPSGHRKRKRRRRR